LTNIYYTEQRDTQFITTESSSFRLWRASNWLSIFTFWWIMSFTLTTELWKNLHPCLLTTTWHSIALWL
jgi:hypothetical protein